MSSQPVFGRKHPTEGKPSDDAESLLQALTEAARHSEYSYSVRKLLLQAAQALAKPNATPASKTTKFNSSADAIPALTTAIHNLQRDKLLFRRVQELAQIGGWQWNRNDDSLFLTEEAHRILRRNHALGTMSALQSCLCKSHRERLQKTLAEIRDGTGFDLELQGESANGTPFWISMIGEPDPHDPTHASLSGTLQDITARKHAEEALRQQAQTDALTGLLNRDAILGHIATRLHAAGKADIALLYIDLDRFKIVNDVLGHSAGDQLLMEAAHRIRCAVEGEATIARFGGDEFLAACRTSDDPTRPERLARQIQCAFLSPFKLGTDEFNVTTSIGISRAPTDGRTPKELIQNADVAMYVSKRRARNGFQAFTQEMASHQQEQLLIETRLRRALDNNEFRLVYQPQVDLRSGKIISAEALIRWHNPELGEMRPDRFIELAETTGEIVRIGHWVLSEACAQMRRWREQNLYIQRVAVNVSYRQFLGENLADTVERLLAEADLPGHALELELTERLLAEDTSDTEQVFDRLRRLGVRLSIDDFGEGYSALNYLRRLPIHGLKLSHSFMKGVPNAISDVAICQTVTGISQSLGLDMVAEGIENELQRNFMLKLGVNIGQGFLYAPGLPAHEFTERLSAQLH